MHIIRSEFISVISTEEPAARVRFEIHSTQFNYNFITSIFIFNGKVKQTFGNKSCKIPSRTFFAFHFLAISLVTLSKR